MDIDINDLKSKEIVKILSMYPQGHLEIKFERVFWSSDYAEPEIPRETNSPPYPNRGQPAPQNSMQGAARTFKKMSDTLGSMVC